jgi:hypothetical protein
VPQKPSKSIVIAKSSEIVPLFSRAMDNVRDDARDNPYLEEAMRVLPAGGYRSAIGSVWNAVVDDLRNKIIYRSVDLFNSSLQLSRKIEAYEDFQNHVNDDQLIDGAYKIGVIGWEASKILKHAKETRHVFDGHPKSTEPSLVKVLAMLDDCVKYVLSQPYPPKIIDITAYLTQMAESDYDRNETAIENALSELPDVYKNELVNRLFSAYVHASSSSVLRSNIEFAAPVLWDVLPKDVKQQIVRRVDQEITAGNAAKTALAFEFVNHVGGQRFLSATSRTYKLAPLVKKLKLGRDDWDIENPVVKELEPYAAYIPDSLLDDYVSALTMTYVGYTGGSARFSRTDFYANGAAIRIPKMFQAFDDKGAASFVNGMRGNTLLRSRIKDPTKMGRLRSLANIVYEKSSAKFSDIDILEALVDPKMEKQFISLLDRKT